MKKIKSLSLWIIIGVGCLLTVGLSLFLIFSEGSISDTNYKLVLFEIDKALMTSVVLGGFTTIVANNIIEISRNNKTLNTYNIKHISGERLKDCELAKMFGGKKTGYASEIKFMFISGNKFTESVKDRLIEAVKNGCHVKVLLADPADKSNFLKNTGDICRQENPYVEQIEYTKSILSEINNLILKNNWPGNVSLRYYTTEYRYNIRIGVHLNEKDEILIRTWTNYQPFKSSPNNLSLCVFSEFSGREEDIIDNNEDNEKRSLSLQISKSFDLIWDKYKDVEL